MEKLILMQMKAFWMLSNKKYFEPQKITSPGSLFRAFDKVRLIKHQCKGRSLGLSGLGLDFVGILADRMYID